LASATAAASESKSVLVCVSTTLQGSACAVGSFGAAMSDVAAAPPAGAVAPPPGLVPPPPLLSPAALDLPLLSGGAHAAGAGARRHSAGAALCTLAAADAAVVALQVPGARVRRADATPGEMLQAALQLHAASTSVVRQRFASILSAD